MAGWLAIVPLGIMAGLSALTASPPDLLVQLEVLAPGNPALPDWALGLLAIGLTLALNVSAFGLLYYATRRPRHGFLHAAAVLLMAIALIQALNAATGMVGHLLPETDLIPQTRDATLLAALRLALVVPILILGLGWLEVRRSKSSWLSAWQRAGLRVWSNPSAIWLALGAGAVIVWPWVIVGSLGSAGTTVASVVQALPGALGEEILFRGFAFAWLWRAAHSRREAAIAALILFVAAQGGTVLPTGDWGALLRSVAALLLGFLVTELTVRGGGSIWPAVIVHFLYDWFHLAFVDSRSQEEMLHWLVRAWAPLSAGGVGVLLWSCRKLKELLRGKASSRRNPVALVTPVVGAGLAWVFVILLYLTAGVPGFHPDGFVIYLEEQADLSLAVSISDPAERRAWVYDRLVQTSERSQAPLRAELDRRGVLYRPHYLVNAIEVLERPGLRRRFAEDPGVASVLFQPGMRRYPYAFRLPDMDLTGPNGIEWNVRKVGADRVWELGYTGQGVIIGDADTGVEWSHPALKAAYLGWDLTGERAVAHDYHWFDPWDGRAEPWDDNGHGTHTTGTVLGLDGENKVGLAPGARWIACRNMRHGIGNPGSYLSCMEFLLAPFPLDGDPLLDGDSSVGAHVVNNSWGCPRREGCLPDTLHIAVENLRTAGQMMVVSAGNEGPLCGTVQDVPAIYDEVFSVGAMERGDRAAVFSNRGPVTVDGSNRPKPDVVAPGVDVRSSVPGGYASLPGTSMAGPHVAGAAALIWSVAPSLIGDVEGTEALLAETAQRLTVDAACPAGSTGELDTVCGCASDGPDSVPNHVYGWGQVDVWAAVQVLLAGE
jgi:subtilisin family serine protease